MKTIVVLGSGFDKDLGLNNSCSDFINSHYCPIPFIKKDEQEIAKWSNFEKALRDDVIEWYHSGQQEQIAEKINLLWQVYTKNLTWFFTKKSDDFVVNQESCACVLLKHITIDTQIYTFNYTNPSEYIKIEKTNKIVFLHGRYYRDTYDKNLMVASQGQNIIIGIDQCIPEDGLNNQYIYPLVKKHHPIYFEVRLDSKLSQAENVVLYGFSMGIVDFCYFEQFFKAILNGSSICKTIYYVTRNEKDFECFLKNLGDFGIDNMVLESKVSLIPIYTTNGTKNEDFCRMLSIL